MSVRVKSSCAHCAKPVELTIDSELNCTVHDPSSRPLVFVPDMDLLSLREESIINAFCRKTVFFWSEEHAREHRKKGHTTRGIYLLPEEMKAIKVMQGVLFGFT